MRAGAVASSGARRRPRSIEFVGGKQEGGGSAAATHEVVLPDGLEPGDLVVIAGLTIQDAAVITAPAGWTQIHQYGSGNGDDSLVAVFARRWDSSLGTSITLSNDQPATTNLWALSFAFRNAVMIEDTDIHCSRTVGSVAGYGPMLSYASPPAARPGDVAVWWTISRNLSTVSWAGSSPVSFTSNQMQLVIEPYDGVTLPLVGSSWQCALNTTRHHYGLVLLRREVGS